MNNIYCIWQLGLIGKNQIAMLNKWMRDKNVETTNKNLSFEKLD